MKEKIMKKRIYCNINKNSVLSVETAEKEVILKTENSCYIVRSVDRALDLLLVMGRKGSEFGITELSRELGTTKSTVHSLLQTLMGKGFIEQNLRNGKYRLGISLFQLGMCCAGRMDVKQVARPYMEALSEETCEIVLLAAPDHDSIVIIDKIEPQRPFLMIPRIDFRIAVHSTAVGKILLAFATIEWREKIVARGLHGYTDYTITKETLLTNELEKIRILEYAIGCNETIEGITCIAVPIRDYTNRVIAALSISSLSSIITSERYAEVIIKLQEKAKFISQRLGYQNY
jgi:DNA-binding IclR family transcriptional regulator